MLPSSLTGFETYKKLGLEYKLKDVMPPSERDMNKYKMILGQYVRDVT
ncbi:MAG: hypothetical protein GX185_03080 [Tissierellia bacterium]|nr:hypothetical protein [Tissierellia bacterium]